MFKKKNKNLHRALIALMVLGLLVCQLSLIHISEPTRH